MAFTTITDRSTYWVVSGNNTPQGYGDYRFYWRIQYEQTATDIANNRTRIRVITYAQAHYTAYHYDSSGNPAQYLNVPSGDGVAKVNGSQISSKNLLGWTVPYGSSYVITELGSATTYVYHNNDGSASFTWQGGGYGKWTAVSTYSTASGHFPKIPRNSVLGSVSTFNVDSGVTVNTTKYVSSYYDRLKIYIGSTLIKTVNNFSSGTKITFTDAELNNIYRTITSNSGTFTFELSTYSDSGYSNKIGSTSSTTAKGNLTIVAPSFSSFDYYDNNSKTASLTKGSSTSDIIVKGYSTLVVSIPTSKQAVANTRGASISHYIVDGQTVTYSSSGVSKSISNYNKDNVSVYAVDTRGNSSSQINISFSALGKYINYTPLTVKDDYDYVRSDNEIGEIVTINFGGTWWNGNFGSANNSLTVDYKFKKSTASGYTTGYPPITASVSGNTFSYNGIINGDTLAKGFDIATSYDVVVTISDELSSRQITYDLHAGEPAIAIFGNKCSLGAAYNESLGGTQIHGQSYIKDNCTIDAATTINGRCDIEGACYIDGENIQNFKGTKISSGTSLPSTVTNGSIFILY